MLSAMLYRCMFCDALSMDLFVMYVVCMTVFVNCLLKQLAICLGVVVILLLNGMVLFSVVGGALLNRLCMCMCCACDPSVRLDAPSICFVCVYRRLSPHLRV